MVAGTAFTAGFLVGRPVKNEYQVVVFPERDVTEEQRQKIEVAMGELDPVDGVEFETREHAWANMKEMYKGGDEDITRGVKAEHLPESFRVKLVRRGFTCDLIDPIQKFPGVDEISTVTFPTKMVPA